MMAKRYAEALLESQKQGHWSVGWTARIDINVILEAVISGQSRQVLMFKKCLSVLDWRFRNMGCNIDKMNTMLARQSAVCGQVISCDQRMAQMAEKQLILEQ